MENSIEEDIKIIENFINWLTIDFEYDSGNEIKTIEHILSDYKKVLKENEQLRTEVNSLLKENEEYSKQLDLDYVDKNYISKKKIEDIIEELKGKLKDISKRREKSKTKEEKTVLWCLEIRTDERIKTLQELL